MLDEVEQSVGRGSPAAVKSPVVRGVLHAARLGRFDLPPPDLQGALDVQSQHLRGATRVMPSLALRAPQPDNGDERDSTLACHTSCVTSCATAPALIPHVQASCIHANMPI